MKRTVPDLLRITIEWVIAPWPRTLHAAQHGAGGDAGGGEHHVALGHLLAA